MAEQHINEESYDFESQLELGEMLLDLGRFEEAAVELKKAKDLNEIGAYSRNEDDPERESDLQRLATAIDRANEVQKVTERRGRLLSFGLTLLLLAIAGGLFAAWSVNRADLREMQEVSTRQAEVVSLQRTEEASLVNYQLSEATRMSEQITDLFQQLGVVAIQATQAAQTVNEASSVINIAEQSVDAQTTLSAIMEELAAESTISAQRAEQNLLATPQPTQPPPTPLSGEALNALIDQIRIDIFAASLRSGPDFNYSVKGRLSQGQLLTVMAKSPDHYWYNVMTEEGVEGWVHSSLAKPVSLDWLPEAATVPAAPVVAVDEPETPEPPATTAPQPTAVPVTPEPPATAVPEPTVVIEPTAEPEPTAAAPEPTSEETAPAESEAAPDEADPPSEEAEATPES